MPVPGVMKAWDRGPERGGGGSKGSGLVGLHMKDMLTGKSFSSSRNWLTLRGAVSRISKALDVQVSENNKMT